MNDAPGRMTAPKRFRHESEAKLFDHIQLPMSAWIWIATKLLFTRRVFLGGSALIAYSGLILGVGFLVVSMAVMSGFEDSLKRAITDVSGHVQVISRNARPEPWEKLEAKIKALEPTTISTTRIVYLEAIATQNGVISSAAIMGVDFARIHDVLNLQPRILNGNAVIEPGSKKVVIGKGMQKNLNIAVGSKLKVVLPMMDEWDPTRFIRFLEEVEVVGVMDFGKHDWNERSLIMDLQTVQKFGRMGDRYRGLIVRMQDADHARDAAFNLTANLEGDFRARDWKDLNQNLFEAVKIEKPIIFCVVFLIVIVAAINISSLLYVTVVQRFPDIAILKTVGVSRRGIMTIFTLQGLLIGGGGVFLGTLVGLLFSALFQILQNNFGLLQGSVYRVDTIEVSVEFRDWIVIAVTTLVISLLATLAPALKGAKIQPVEGLRYE